MHNWRLLLLAFLAAFQPIASFTERSLVDGRQECSENHGLWDSRLSIYGTYRHAKPAEERRVNHRENREARESRRYEIKDGHSALATPERRVVDFSEEVRVSPERSARYARVQYRARDTREGFDNRLTGLSTSNDWRNSLRDTDRRHRSREVSRERVRESRDTRQNERQQREPSYERTDRIDKQRSRFSVDARRRDSRRHGNFLRESRTGLHRSRVEVARMEPARRREDTRVPMERARQVDRKVGSRRDARLQHRERALGRLARDESQRRLSSRDTRSSNGRVRDMRDSGKEINNLMSEEHRRGDSGARFAVDRREIRRDSTDERSFARREARDRTERSTELRSRDLSHSRILEARASEPQRSRDISGLQRSRDLESPLTKRSIQLRSRDISRSGISEARSSELRNSRALGDLERGTTERSIKLRSRDYASSRSLEARSSELRRLRDFERRSNKRSTELERSRDVARTRTLEARSSDMDKRSNERLSKLMRSMDFDKHSAERSTELRRAKDVARSRSLATRSVRTERATEGRPETPRNFDREAERLDTRQSYVQNREERRSLELRRVVDLRTSDRSTRLGTQKNEADFRTRDRDDRRTVSETRRVESRRMNEWSRNDEIERHDKSNRRSTESRTRYSVKARNIKNVLERDTIVSRSRANVEARRNGDAWSFGQEKSQIEAQNVALNWQCLFYTVQAIYLASFLVTILGDNGASEKKIRSHGFCTAAKKLLKLE